MEDNPYFFFTNADAASIVQHGAIGALTTVTTNFVDALTISASIQSEILTFVNIFANIGRCIQLSSSRANALLILIIIFLL